MSLPMTEKMRLTKDGSYTFFSAEFGEAYHSFQGAKTEAFDKFVAVTDLKERAQSGSLALLDVCYGLGYNSAAALETIWAANPHCQVHLYGLELDPEVMQAAVGLDTFAQWSPQIQAILKDLAFRYQSRQPNVTAQILVGDARQQIQTLMAEQVKADAIFLDPFSPRKCPQLWTVEFLTHVAACLSQTGVLATYSRSAAVRAALLQAGLKIGTVLLPNQEALPAHAWSQGTLAQFDDQALTPLTDMEQEHLLTRAGIAFSDPSGQDSAAVILARQSAAQNQSNRESTSSWRRRWKIA